jgi:DNA invertase Pin-like site-specific DNA recombinase
MSAATRHLCEIGNRLDAKGVGLKVLDQAIDTTTPTGRLMFNTLGAIAQFERELIRERMLVGIAKAKAEGKYKGRAPTARAKADKVKQLRAAGVGPSEIARQLSISRTSVFRILTA